MKKVIIDTSLEKDVIVGVGRHAATLSLINQQYSRLRSLTIEGNVHEIEGKLPDTLRQLTIGEDGYVDLTDTLPDSLTTLMIHSNKVSLSRLPIKLSTLYTLSPLDVSILSNCTSLEYLSVTTYTPLDILELPKSLVSVVGNFNDAKLDLTLLPNLTTLNLLNYKGTILDCNSTIIEDLRIDKSNIQKVINLPNTLTSLTLRNTTLLRDSLILPESIKLVNMTDCFDTDGNVFPPPVWPKGMKYYNGSSLYSYK